MIDRTESELDAFETALLAELQQELRRTASPLPVPSPGRTRRAPSHRARGLAAAAAVAAALVVATQVPGLGPTPAYAVTGRNNGEVVVRVNRLEGADSLEQALREHGIPADITYLPYGKECAPGRYTERMTPGLMLGVADDWFEVTIPPGAVGKDDTLVLFATPVPGADGFSTTSFDIAQGTVRPCRVIDAPSR